MKQTWLPLLLAASLGACVVHEAPAPVAGPGPAAYAGWERLGERWVNGRADRDIVHVGRKEGRFHRIQIVVESSALEMFDVLVVFGDGSTYSPSTRLVFEPNTKSRVIDLPGGARVIRRVEFRYGNLPG